jgi:hypothetical protein
MSRIQEPVAPVIFSGKAMKSAFARRIPRDILKIEVFDQVHALFASSPKSWILPVRTITMSPDRISKPVRASSCFKSSTVTS